MPRTGIEPVTRGISVLCSTNWAIWAFFLCTFTRQMTPSKKMHKKIAGAGFEPTTFGLWARRASRLLHPASIFTLLLYTISIKISILILNGWRWIRTTEACRNRFTVCPLWPLGNPSIWNWLSPRADDRTRTDNLLITNQLLCQLSHIGKWNGAYRARTYDPLLVRQMLSQLS